MIERLSKSAGKLNSARIISETDADVYTYGFFSIFYDTFEYCDDIFSWNTVSACNSLHFTDLILHSHTNKCRRTSRRQPDEMLHKFNHYDCSFACCDQMNSHSSCYFRCSACSFGDCNMYFGTYGNGE